MSDYTCPSCGSEELVELAGSSNAYCPDCCEVVEPVECVDYSPCANCGCSVVLVGESCEDCGFLCTEDGAIDDGMGDM
jgi:hypothetical protein